MVTPQFTFDEEANGYISEPFSVDEQAMVHIELASRAPLVTLKEVGNGEYANFGQSPKNSDAYEVAITTKRKETLRLAVPVEVTKCYVMN